MSNYSLGDIIQSTDRHKLYTLVCSPNNHSDYIGYLNSHGINTIDIGKELAEFINNLEDYSYLDHDVIDFVRKLLDKHKSKINDSGNEVVAIHNIGILLEPALKLNATQLLRETSKTTALIILWEHSSEMPDRLHWPTQQHAYFLDFADTQIKKLQYAI